MFWLTTFFLILYFPRIAAWFGCMRPQKRLQSDKKRRLALIIPARNEGRAVLPLFETIRAQSYDKEYFDAFVVVKEADDPVIGYAKDIGAAVYVDESQTCKGDCLDYCIKEILKEYPNEYDGYIIVDADCRLDKNFLAEMNHAMESGAQVINAKKLVSNYDSEIPGECNHVTSCNGLIWTIIDELGNRFKSDHGLTTMTISTGILFRRELIEEWQGWPYKETLTEDMELQRDCGVKGIHTFYYSHAKIYMQEAPSLTDTNKRRRRWMTGLVASDRLYWGRLRKRRGVRAFWDNYYLLCLWIAYLYIGSLCLIIFGNLAGAVVLAAQNLISGRWLLFGTGQAALAGAAAFGLIYLSFFVLTMAAVLADWENIGLPFFGKLELMFLHPLFYMEYIRIVAKAVRKDTPQQWEEIKRIDIRAKY